MIQQHTILELVAAKVSEVSGKLYKVDYLPQRNISDQEGIVYRCITPGSLTCDTNTRHKYPATRQEVIVSIFAVPSACTLTDSIITYQNELHTILYALMSRGEPVLLDCGNARISIVGGESKPVQDSGIALAGLFDDPPVIIGSLSFTLLVT